MASFCTWERNLVKRLVKRKVKRKISLVCNNASPFLQSNVPSLVFYLPGFLALSLPLLLALSSAEVLCPGNRTGNDVVGRGPTQASWLLCLSVVKPDVLCKAVGLRLLLVFVVLVYSVTPRHASECLFCCLKLREVELGWPFHSQHGKATSKSAP